MTRFKEHCLKEFGRTEEQFEVMHKQIRKVLSAAMFAATGKLNHLNGCFELLGCDIMIDDNYNPHLIEINTNPAIYLDTKP